MSKVKEKILFVVMVVQSSGVSFLYMNSRINKWKWQEELTAFIYPIFLFFLLFLVLISFFISLFYLLWKVIHTSKYYHSVPLLILIIIFILSNKYFNESKLRDQNFKDYELNRQVIVDYILEGILTPDESGIVQLPDELENEEMARRGCIYIVKYKDKKGIYFCTFSGVLDSSAGFIFLTEDINDYNTLNYTIKLHQRYGENWYYCGTNS